MSRIDESLHPILMALFRELPPAGSNWPKEDRVRWLRAASAAVDYIYKTDDSLEIKLDQEAANIDAVKGARE